MVSEVRPAPVRQKLEDRTQRVVPAAYCHIQVTQVAKPSFSQMSCQWASETAVAEPLVRGLVGDRRLGSGAPR